MPLTRDDLDTIRFERGRGVRVAMLAQVYGFRNVDALFDAALDAAAAPGKAAPTPATCPPPSAPLARRPGRPIGSTTAARPTRRFTDHGTLNPDRQAAALAADHSALTERRTMFPSTVVQPDDSERLLVSGANQRKLGDRITKGPWRGLKLYALSLEERATCPDTCHLWAECYGNAMPFARRHAHGSTLMDRLRIELWALAAKHRRGFAVRLHLLGDFWSADYVQFWCAMVGSLKGLHVFGYTAWAPDTPVGRAVRAVNETFPDRFVVRTSVAPEAKADPAQVTTIWRVPDSHRVPEGLVCPAQTGATDCCGTCGLCWAPAMRDTRIVFVGHGMRKRGAAVRGAEQDQERPRAVAADQHAATHAGSQDGDAPAAASGGSAPRPPQPGTKAARILEMSLAGASADAIAAAVETTKRTVQVTQTDFRKRGLLSPVQPAMKKDRVLELAKAGRTPAQIAVEAGIRREAVNAFMHALRRDGLLPPATSVGGRYPTSDAPAAVAKRAKRAAERAERQATGGATAELAAPRLAEPDAVIPPPPPAPKPAPRVVHVPPPRPSYVDRDGNPAPYVRADEQAGKIRPVPGTGYSRARWQIDAHHLSRSSGDRLVKPEEWAGFDAQQVYRLWKAMNLSQIYDFDHHVRIGEELEARGKLPPTFMLLPPHSWHPDVWTDVAQMLSLNTAASQAGAQMHLCLARGSLVLTYRGYIPIEQVRVGDMVLTHKGRWRPVTVARMTGIQPVVDLRAQGVGSLTLTPDHKLWTRKVRDIPSARMRARVDADRAEPGWVRADETVGSYVNLKLPPVEDMELSHRDCWLIGRWLADGHVGARGDFWVSIGKDKLPAFEEVAGEHAGTRSEYTAVQIRLKGLSGIVSDVLRRCGRGADGKSIPGDLLSLPSDKARSVLDGYLSGDGHYVAARNRWTASSVSRALLLGVAMLAQRAHGALSSVYAGRPAGTATIEGRQVATRQEWVLSFDMPDEERRTGLPFIREDGAWKKVRTVDPAGEAETWCLRVEEDESFTAEGCIVKNCPLPFDIVDRLIMQFSQPDEVVFDPFGGLMTVPYRALKLGRRGIGVELNPAYFLDGVKYCEAMAREIATPSLFDLLDASADVPAVAAE